MKHVQIVGLTRSLLRAARFLGSVLPPPPQTHLIWNLSPWQDKISVIKIWELEQYTATKENQVFLCSEKLHENHDEETLNKIQCSHVRLLVTFENTSTSDGCLQWIVLLKVFFSKLNILISSPIAIRLCYFAAGFFPKKPKPPAWKDWKKLKKKFLRVHQAKSGTLLAKMAVCHFTNTNS